MTAVLALGLAVGTALVVTGGDDSDSAGVGAGAAVGDGDTGGDGRPEDLDDLSATPPGGPDTSDGAPLPALELEDSSQAEIEQLSGLVVPEGARDFLTAQLADATQLDVTFLMPADAERDFVEDSGLDEPVAGDRPILHSSPLWQLNPDSGEIRGVADTRGEVRRTVELVDEGEGLVRARIVITRTPTG